jgi:putative transposase
MPEGLRRYHGKGDLHFVTFSCYRRLPLLRSACARDVSCGIGESPRQAAISVMPEHVHLLMSEPATGTPSTVHRLKLSVSRRLRKRKKNSTQLALPFGEMEPLRAFWQARFYDFNVYSGGKVKEKLNYMHANPVVRRLVNHPKDWRWSSWGFYGKGEKGLIRIDGV